ncbi:RagB/SusD family nutrient uptake outer membrane protein [Spirosoma daeguense]
MKPITSFTRSLLLATLLVGASSCANFVNLTPQDVIPVSGFYRTEADIQGALTGAYGSMRPIYNSYFQFTELPSDNTRTISASEVAHGPFDKLTWLTSFAPIASFWNNAYGVIAAANITLAHADQVTFARAAAKTQLVGEAKFIRALMYFNLVRFFGNVPLVLTEITAQEEAFNLVRTPIADVYAQIEKDLSEAETALPATYTGANVGRATSGAAKALLGKVFLQEKKWPQAEAKLAEVVAGGRYQLLADLTKVFGPGNDNNAEIVFACQYLSTGNGEGNTFSYAFAPSTANATSVAAGNSNIGTLDLFNAFETGDQRKTAYVAVDESVKPTNYYARKFVYNVMAVGEGDNDWPIIRYADVLLMYAEALNRNGKTDLALTQLNPVRKRAGLGAKTVLSVTDTQLAIEQERRVELCFEGHRWHDLIRWDKAISTMIAFKAKYASLDGATSNMLPDAYRTLFSIPETEVLLNSKLTQNPGY